jgi:(1->4)-alpha-D-glucan 1-alpha-D-glucosylmutase
MDHMYSGEMKLFVTHEALRHRRLYDHLYSKGEYVPLKIAGERSKHSIALARRHNHSWAAVVVPRFITDLVKENQFPLGPGVWRDTGVELPDGAPRTWRDMFTGKEVSGDGSLLVKDILDEFPIGLLEGEVEQ